MMVQNVNHICYGGGNHKQLYISRISFIFIVHFFAFVLFLVLSTNSLHVKQQNDLESPATFLCYSRDSQPFIQGTVDGSYIGLRCPFTALLVASC